MEPRYPPRPLQRGEIAPRQEREEQPVASASELQSRCVEAREKLEKRKVAELEERQSQGARREKSLS